jgi:NAD(P)-dependent dehydrogenase (short-subunit alcohol dehydrogenase family)
VQGLSDGGRDSDLGQGVDVDRSCVVTGGGRGIGRVLVKRLARDPEETCSRRAGDGTHASRPPMNAPPKPAPSRDAAALGGGFHGPALLTDLAAPAAVRVAIPEPSQSPGDPPPVIYPGNRGLR